MKPIHFVGWLLLKNSIRAYHDGIPLSTLGPDTEEVHLFVKKTKEALDLLMKTDEKRYKRVKNELNMIVYNPTKNLKYAGLYVPRYRYCLINLQAFQFNDDPGHKVSWYACVLLHEATHGKIYEKMGNYNRFLKQRIERICTEEEIRLARKFHDGKAAVWEAGLRKRFSQI